MALAEAPYTSPVLGQVNQLQEVQQQTTSDEHILAQEEPLPEDDSPVLQITINNVVSTFSTRCHLNLRTIAMTGMNVIMRKESGMVSMKMRKPHTTSSIWSSGKITVTGATSEEEGKVASRRVARKLQTLGFRCRFTNFRVVNVLGTCSLPFGIKIQSFSKQYPREASYEPELHPGVTYRIRDPKATLKIFSTGSITVTAPRVINIQMAIQHIYPLVFEYQMEKPPLKRDQVLQEDPYLTNPHLIKRVLHHEPPQHAHQQSQSQPQQDDPAVKHLGKRRYQPLADYKSLKRPKEDWSDTSDDEFDSDDSQE